jgi:hypothetical protein
MAPAVVLNTTDVIVMDVSVEASTSISLLDVDGPCKEAGIKMNGLDNPGPG